MWRMRRREGGGVEIENYTFAYFKANFYFWIGSLNIHSFSK